nr:3D domain-containing protein [Microcystis wesenbergii]
MLISLVNISVISRILHRTIAVDKTVIPLGTVIYIPDARGKEVILPSGKKVKHDGYFFAADVGSAIKGNNIDTFLGITNKNPFSHVKSDPSKTFTAFVITDTRIKSALNTLHKS